MASFADQVPDARARDDLQVAVDGKGAFRRFQAALDRHEAAHAPTAATGTNSSKTPA